MRGTLPAEAATEKIAAWRGVISPKAQECACEGKTYSMHNSFLLPANECPRRANQQDTL